MTAGDHLLFVESRIIDYSKNTVDSEKIARLVQIANQEIISDDDYKEFMRVMCEVLDEMGVQVVWQSGEPPPPVSGATFKTFPKDVDSARFLLSCLSSMVARKCKESRE